MSNLADEFDAKTLKEFWEFASQFIIEWDYEGDSNKLITTFLRERAERRESNFGKERLNAGSVGSE